MAKKKTSIDLLSVGLGLLAGTAVGGAAYALDGLDLGTGANAGILAGAGLVLGVGISMLNPGFGAGLAGGGSAVALKGVLDHYVTGSADNGAEEDTGQIRRRRRSRGRRRGTRGRRNMGAVRAQLGAVRTDISGVSAEFSGVEAEFSGV